jgi:ADP-dependent NAD(P)H-hydrate dehydratase / NAD(P)H-hydrate epimerase
MIAKPILTADQMRAAEQAADCDLETLMARAGEALGPGNNGGDGYGAAHWLGERGERVRVVALAPPATALARAAADGWTGTTEGADAEAWSDGLLVDCLFGTGLNRSLDAAAAALLRRHAAAASRIIAADLPSGVDSDSGMLLGCPIAADVTLAFGALKPAHLVFPAAARCGRVELAPIGIDGRSDVMTAVMPVLIPPDWQSHKYRRGLVAVVAGTMAGAAELAARAALRSGAGYVRLIGSASPPAAPRAIVRQSWRDGAALADPRIDAIVIGCGLGSGLANDGRAAGRLEAAMAAGRPLVVDGDALALVGSRSFAVPAILTPHGGEFARMMPDAAPDKIAATRLLAARHGAVVIHKGADTVIAAPDGRVAIQSPGDAWLSSAGTGDILAGICGAMLARGIDAFDAAQAAVLLHQRAAARAGAGLCADDLTARAIWP